MEAVDAQVLGRIILLQSTLHLMQEEEAIARFVCRGCAAIPGVDAAGMYLNGAFHSEIADSGLTAVTGARLFDDVAVRVREGGSPDGPISDFQGRHQLECVLIQTGLDLYGILFLKVANRAGFIGYRPYIDNTANLIALTAENNRQRALLLRHQADLEAAVVQRTCELEASRENYKTLFESIRDVIVVADLERRIISVNPAFADLFGYRIDEVLGRRTRLLYADPSQYDHLGGRLEEKPPDEDLLLSIGYRKRSGEVFTGETRVFDLKDTGGETIGYMGLIRDISDRVRAEEERKRLEAQLFQSRKMEAIGTLSGGIAHDFNNMLAIIIGNAEMARDDIPPWSPAHRFVEEVVTAGLRARDVVRQLLTFSRKSEQKKEPVDLSPIVKEALKLIRSSLPATIDMRWTLPERLPAVEADPTQIHQIMLNLCGNAADAMADAGGRLSVFLEAVSLTEGTPVLDADLPPGDYLRLTVADTGPGISSRDAGRIFDPYYSTKAVGKGTGMGLAVVHGIVKGHCGGIRVRSRKAGGAAFDIFFPAVAMAASREPVIDGAVPGGKERILVVDDEEVVARMNGQRLRRLGYRVEDRTDPVAALSLFETDPAGFDLVITDMTMPGMTGDELTRRLLRIRPDLPVLLCTGYSEKISEERAAALGIRKYLEKPVGGRDLAVSIREVLDQPSSP